MKRKAVLLMLGITLILGSYSPTLAEEMVPDGIDISDEENDEISNSIVLGENGFSGEESISSESGFSDEISSFEEEGFTDEILSSEENGFSDTEADQKNPSADASTEDFPTEISDDASEVTLMVVDGCDITEELNRVLKVMGQRASDENPCKVVIPPGSYKITGTIHMYSNLTLYAEGAVLTKTSTTKHILLRLGEEVTSQGGYDGYRNVIIEGGTWDCNYMNVEEKETGSGFVGFRIGHARNVIVKNVTFLNNLKSHFLEIAGVRDVVVTGCTFRGYWEGYEAGGQECIQLDACLDYIFPGYQPFDGAVCENVRIEGNTFENVFAGVGSHSMIFDRPYKHIIVRQNTFRNIKKRAVWFLNYTDSVVEDNVMENVGGGVLVSNLFLSNTHLSPDQNAGTDGNHQSGEITVQRNQISISDTSSINGTAWKGYGILVEGSKIQDGEKADARGVPAGIYRENNVSVLENTITGPGRGIQLYLAKNCVVSGNQLALQRSASFSNIGICIAGASENEIRGNQVSGCKNVGIYIYNGGTKVSIPSEKNQIVQNTISNTGGDGILTDSESTGTVVSGNQILSGQKNGIYLRNSKNCQLTGNLVSGSRLDGIILENLGNPSVKSNTVSKSGGRGIIAVNSTVRALAGNTITDNRKCGLYITDSKLAGYRKNKLQNNNSSYGIYAKRSGGVISVKMPRNSQITRKTVKIKGTAQGGKNLTVYAILQKGNRKIGRGTVQGGKNYVISVKKQKKGTRLLFVLKDRYGNICYQIQKVK